MLDEQTTIEEERLYNEGEILLSHCGQDVLEEATLKLFIGSGEDVCLN